VYPRGSTPLAGVSFLEATLDILIHAIWSCCLGHLGLDWVGGDIPCRWRKEASLCAGAGVTLIPGVCGHHFFFFWHLMMFSFLGVGLSVV